MKIQVQNGPTVSLPTPLLLSVLRRYGCRVTFRQAAVLGSLLRRYRRAHPQWVFVTVERADGRTVSIRL